MVKSEICLYFQRSLYGGNTIKIRNKDNCFIVHPSLNDEPLYKSKELINEIQNLANNCDIIISAKRITKIRKAHWQQCLGRVS